MPTTIKVEKDTLLDMINAVIILTSMLSERVKYQGLSEDEENRLKYINKIITHAKATISQQNY